MTETPEIPDSVIAEMEMAYFDAQDGVEIGKRTTVGMRAALAAALPHLNPEPTFTASEVKELTTKATEVALALGRKEAGEALERLENEFRILSDPSYAHKTGATAWREAYAHAHECVLQEQQTLKGEDLMGYPLPSPDATSAQTAASGHSDLPPTPECRGCGQDGTGLENHNRDCRQNPLADLPEGRDQ